MKDLSIIREQIDSIDSQLLNLFEQRMELCDEVADFKIANNKQVLDKQRENEKLTRIEQLVDNANNKKGARQVFSQIMAVSRKLQYKKLAANGYNWNFDFILSNDIYNSLVNSNNTLKVVYQGVKGAYSYEAATEYFKNRNIELSNVETFRMAMQKVKNGECDYAVLPIENSTAGIVNEVYDLLIEYDNYIVDDILIPINHALLGLSDASIERIDTVYSHPQALMQCNKFLEEYPSWQLISKANTAISAKQVVDEANPSIAAIASPAAAKLYGLKVLKEGINHNTFNTTRFIIVSNKRICTKKASTISICIELPHESGSLYNILSHFIFNDINMTKIESRPIIGKNWEYRFYIEFEGNFQQEAAINALYGIQAEASKLTILGCF